MPKKSKKKRILGFTLAGTLVFSFLGYVGYREFRDRSRNLEYYTSQIYSARESPEFKSSVNKAIELMIKKERKELAFNDESIFDPEEISASDLTILHEDSPLLRPYFEQIGEEMEKYIRDNVDWFVFSPNVTAEKGDVGGLSIGRGTILIDTEADDGGKKNPKTFPSVMAHEACHEANKSLGLPTLEDEKRAYQMSMKALEKQLMGDDDTILKAFYNDAKKRVKTAEFLQQFGSDFNHVYPNGVILAKDLLDANLPAEKFSGYRRKLEGKGGLNYELYTASYFAEMVKTKAREEALRELYRFITNPEYEGTIVRVSAASALQYLSPEACKVETGADVVSDSGRTASLSFGKREKTDKIGQGYEKSAEFSVSGAPSLEELLADERFKDFDMPTGGEGAVESVKVEAEYELYSGDRIKQRIDSDGVKQVYIPNREGKPDSRFFRCYIEAVDTDGNGRNDALRVYYGSNSISSRGGILVKVDVYKNKRYVKSGLTWFAAKEQGEDLELNINDIWRKWNME